MALSVNQQILEILRKSEGVLICFRKNYTLDGITSSIVLFRILKMLKKPADVVCDGFTLSKNLNWLKNDITVHPKITQLQKFVINLDISENGMEELSYKTDNDKLSIFITPEIGNYSDKNLKSAPTPYKYDCIITLDTPDLESLGSVYFDNSDFFYNTPIINIDHNGENEKYGQINNVVLTAVACGEILYDMIKSFDETLLDEKIATYILAGMISKTKSFKTSNVTPRALQTASELVTAGAKKDLVIKNLFRNQTLSILNLWGKILHRMKSDLNDSIVWSLIPEDDYIEASTTRDDLLGIIDELVTMLPQVEIIILFYKFDNKIHVIMHSTGRRDVLELTRQYDPQGSKDHVTFTLNKKNIIDAENEVMRSVKEKLTSNN